MNEQAASARSASWKTRAAIVLLGALGAVVFNILPLFLGSASDSLGLNDAQLGLLGSAYLGGYAVMIAAGFFWVEHWPWRKTLAGALTGATVLFSLVGFVQDFVLIATLIAGCGVCLGTLYGLGYPAIARLPNPERLIGMKMAAEAALGTTLLFLLPNTVVIDWGFSGVTWLIAALCLFGLFLVRSFPQPAELPPAAGPEKPAADSRRTVILAMGGLAIYTGGMTGVWAFVERMGVEGRFEPGQIGGVLGLSLVLAVAAAFAAAAKGDAGNQHLPHFIGLGGILCAALLCLGSGDFLAYAAGVLILNGSWFFVFPYQQALATRAATSQKVVMLVPAMSALGAAVGPGLAGILKTGSSFVPVFGLGIATSIAGFLAFRVVLANLAPGQEKPAE